MMVRCRRVASIVVPAVISVIAQALAVVLDSDDEGDGRSHRRPISRRFSMRHSLFVVADNNSVFDEGWFRNQFRCSKKSFDYICKLIDDNWILCHDPIHHNSCFFVRDRTAVTIFYLTHPGSLAEAASLFGMSKATALRSVTQVVAILISIMPSVIRLPETAEKWEQLASGMEKICGFPNCVLSVDGCLFQIERPHDYEGWYCRKGYPALNVQMVVDHRGKLRSFDIRPGSANDKAMFNYSEFGSTIDSVVPKGKHVVADAGYKATVSVMVPYPVEEVMKPEVPLFGSFGKSDYGRHDADQNSNDLLHGTQSSRFAHTEQRRSFSQ